MKIAVIGASLDVHAGARLRLLEHAGRPARSLLDIDPDPLALVGAMAPMDARPRTASTVLSTPTDDLDRAIDGADSAPVQIRVGGQAARYLDETIPLACGCIGQETIASVASRKRCGRSLSCSRSPSASRERAAMDAWIVDFTNPVGIVMRSLLDDGHRAFGLCNVAIGFQRWFARMLDVDPERVVVDQVGLNHLTWVRAVWVDGADVLPDLARQVRRRAPANRPRLPRRSSTSSVPFPPTTCATSTRTTVSLAEQLGGVHARPRVAEIERRAPASCTAIRR